MTEGARASFLAGGRPDDVLVYLAAAAVSGIETLAERGERVDDGVVLVLDAQRGRRVAKRAMGTDPMTLASRAMDSVGTIDLDAVSGTCPAASGKPEDRSRGSDGSDSGEPRSESADAAEHALRSVFAFAEERNDEVGGIYAEGDVIHAYAVCTCGTPYSDRWVAAET